MPSNSFSGDLFFKIFLGACISMLNVLHTITCIYDHSSLEILYKHTSAAGWPDHWKITSYGPGPIYDLSKFITNFWLNLKHKVNYLILKTWYCNLPIPTVINFPNNLLHLIMIRSIGTTPLTTIIGKRESAKRLNQNFHVQYCDTSGYL